MRAYEFINEDSRDALAFATRAHQHQTRAGGDPYISHPVRVANAIKQYKKSHNLDALISAAYLHDTLEDTDTTHEALHDLFGGLVASLVKELTSDPDEIKKMGKSAYLSQKMAAMSSWALVIKLADRLDNVKDITTAKTPEWRQRYKKETEQILNYIEEKRALSNTHKKLISLIRDKLNEIPTQGDINESSDDRALAYEAHLLATLPQIMKLFANRCKGWTPSEEQMKAAVKTGYTVMKHTGDTKQAGEAVMYELNTLFRMNQGRQGMSEGSLNEFFTGSRDGDDDDDDDDLGPGLTRQEFKNALKLALGYDISGVDVSTLGGGMLRIEVNGERRIVPCNKLGVKDAANFVKRIKKQGVSEAHKRGRKRKSKFGRSITTGWWGGLGNDSGEGVSEGFSNDMSTENMIAYLRQHHDKNLHQDYLNHITSTNSKFVLKNIPLTSIRTELSGLDRAKVEQYKKMDFSKAPPIVVGSDGNILDGYHRATVAKALGIPTIRAYVGVKGQQGVEEGLEQNYLSQIPNLSWKPVSRSVWNTIQDEGLDEEQDTPSHSDWVMASLSIDAKDAQALMAFESDAIGDFNRFDIHLKSRYPGLTDLIDYDRGTVTIVKPINKQGVAEDTTITPKIGINVKSDGDIDYADLIVDGKKKYESRKTDSLRAYVGKTVGVVRTGKGAATAIGQVTIGEPIVVDAEKFDKLRNQHLVPKHSKFDIEPNSVKYLYPLTNPIRWTKAKLIKNKGIVARQIQEQGVSEGKIKLSTDPNWYGAEVADYKASGPVVNIPANRLVGFEPDDKMNQSASKANVEKIIAGLKQGAKLPPLLVRRYKNDYQVLDGHHRFWAYKLLGVKAIPVQVVPESDIEEIGKQGVTEAINSVPPVLYHATYRPLLRSIKQNGLGGQGSERKRWTDSARGVVYLAITPEVAESYAETSDEVSDEWLDEIVVLKIRTANLDSSKFYIDRNVQDNTGDTLEYHGVIPASEIFR